MVPDSDESGDGEQRPEWVKREQEHLEHAHEQGWPHWTVSVRLDCREGRQVFTAVAPHRAGAKKYVLRRLDDECNVTEWQRTYIPRPSWDCPNCNTHEAMATVPNMRGKWDWKCQVCSYRTIGHPYEPEVEAGKGETRHF